MTLARRVAALETELSPGGLVLRWLDEAHAFGDLASYVRSLLDADPSEFPLDRLCREAVRGARAGVRGRRPEVVDAATRGALRETVFRFELAMRINVAAHDLLEREVLIDAALAGYLALLIGEGRAARRADATYLERLATLRDLLTLRATELHAAQEARAVVERRYLDGHVALFPDALKAWDDQRRNTESLADLACRAAELDGTPPAPPRDPIAVSTRSAELVADLVEPARADALEKLGEGERSIGIAMAWLRAKLEPIQAETDEEAGLVASTR